MVSTEQFMHSCVRKTLAPMPMIWWDVTEKNTKWSCPFLRQNIGDLDASFSSDTAVQP